MTYDQMTDAREYKRTNGIAIKQLKKLIDMLDSNQKIKKTKKK